MRFRPSLLAPMLLLAAGPVPALHGQARVQIQPRCAVIQAGSSLQLHAQVSRAASPDCLWSVQAEGGQVAPDGTFRGAPGTYRLRATSRADPGTWDEVVVVVLPDHPALDLVSAVLGPQALSPGWSSALPFRDIAGSGRFGAPHMKVHAFADSRLLRPHTVGYGLPVALPLPRTGLGSEGRLLSYLESGAPVRLDVTGNPAPLLRIRGSVERAQVENLNGTGNPRHWTSQTQRLTLKVRGLVPLAGSVAASPGDADGAWLGARFRRPAGLALLPCGSLLVADDVAHVLRLVRPDHQVSTLLGEPGQPGHRNGQGSHARFRAPSFVAARPAGAWGSGTDPVFVLADSGNHVIRAVDGQGQVTDLAGCPERSGYRDGPGRQALFHTPRGLAMDALGQVYVADWGNRVIRRIAPDGTVSTLAGRPGQAGSQDGPGDRATFRDLKGLALASADGAAPEVLLHVLDGHSVRDITGTGAVSTLCGDPERPGAPNGPEPAALAGVPCLDQPWAILAFRNFLCLTERGNHGIRVLRPEPDGRVRSSVLVGDRDQVATRYGLLRFGIPGPLDVGYATLGDPMGLALDPGGSLYVADGPAIHLCAQPLLSPGLVFPEAHLQPGPRVRCGTALALKITGPTPFLEPDDLEEAPQPFFWSLESLDPATGDALIAPLRGESRCPSTQVSATYPEPGPVDLHLTCVTADGVSMKQVLRIQVE